MNEFLYHATTGHPRSPAYFEAEEWIDEDELLDDIIERNIRELTRRQQEEIERLEKKVDWWKRQAQHIKGQFDEISDMYEVMIGRTVLEDYQTYREYKEEQELEERHDRT